MEFIEKLEEVNSIIEIIRTYIISSLTYYMALRITNYKKVDKKKFVKVGIYLIFVVIIHQIIALNVGNIYSIIYLVLTLSIILSKSTKWNIEYTIIITTISLSINYILFIIATLINFIPAIIFEIKNDYIALFGIISVYIISIQNFFKIKKLKKGLLFLQSKLKDEHFSMTIVYISVPILFIVANLPNYKLSFSMHFLTELIILAILMFITIQRSLQMYYKQKMLIQELEETRKELESKIEEIKEMDQEILSFNKTSHSIAHRQKVLENRIEELTMKSETAEEIDIRSRLNTITKEIQNKETQVELTKTGIERIDNMLKCMQTECVKNKIDFQTQIVGSIYHMINKYVSEEELEILLADHIKNAIIAINHANTTNKSIHIRLGKIDDIYSLYISDTGIEFEEETLKNLGKKPSTTHKDEGGTGIGFMNTFDTLNKHKASLIIKEIGVPSKDNFTKTLIIKFDNKHEFKIETYKN